jgi:hypothetical protein
MSSDLFLHPVFDIAKTLPGVADPKVVDPTPENRVDYVSHDLRVGIDDDRTLP